MPAEENPCATQLILIACGVGLVRVGWNGECMLKNNVCTPNNTPDILGWAVALAGPTRLRVVWPVRGSACVCLSVEHEGIQMCAYHQLMTPIFACA
jgi:hypothetical protein